MQPNSWTGELRLRAERDYLWEKMELEVFHAPGCDKSRRHKMSQNLVQKNAAVSKNSASLLPWEVTGQRHSPNKAKFIQEEQEDGPTYVHWRLINN